MSKVRVLTPVVAVKDNMEDAQVLNVGRLTAGKIRVGLLENSKPNARLLFNYVGELLGKDGVAGSFSVLDKSDSPGSNPASIGATEAVFNRLSQEADIVLTGLGN